MQPVVCIVERNEVGVAVAVDYQTVDPEHQVDGSAANQKKTRPVSGPCQGKPRKAEQDVNQVVKDTHLEQAEKFRISVVPGEFQSIEEIGGDARDEAGDADKQKRQPDKPGGHLDWGTCTTRVHEVPVFPWMFADR